MMIRWTRQGTVPATTPGIGGLFSFRIPFTGQRPIRSIFTQMSGYVDNGATLTPLDIKGSWRFYMLNSSGLDPMGYPMEAINTDPAFGALSEGWIYLPVNPLVPIVFQKNSFLVNGTSVLVFVPEICWSNPSAVDAMILALTFIVDVEDQQGDVQLDLLWDKS